MRISSQKVRQTNAKRTKKELRRQTQGNERQGIDEKMGFLLIEALWFLRDEQ